MKEIGPLPEQIELLSDLQEWVDAIGIYAQEHEEFSKSLELLEEGFEQISTAFSQLEELA